ncbi:MAG: molybdate ABC transporter substrate-binding protein, partial [Alphaproteobacteria bacterium]|nr:molybdate ABC transporter substrate-binding protein [Alphaproteobacteria bacterium]
MIRRWFAALSVMAALLATGAVQGASVTVFAAASLTNALSDVGKAYKAKTGNDVVFSFAASSVLAKQIEASGGADVFLPADTDWMDYLDKKGLLAPGTRKNLLGNQLVLIAPKDSKTELTIAPGFALAAALGDGRLAMADPAAVPAGKYGRAALEKLGVWDAVSGRIAAAENVRAALL